MCSDELDDIETYVESFEIEEARRSHFIDLVRVIDQRLIEQIA